MHIYQDGSIHLNHGGTEMGQGLNTKVAQVVADEFQVDHRHHPHHRDDHRQGAQHVGDGGIVRVPISTAWRRPMPASRSRHGLLPLHVRTFRRSGRPGGVRAEPCPGGQPADPVSGFHQARPISHRIQLSAAGFYKTPKIHWDRDKGQGRPFFYYAYGAAVSEVSIDTLTGEYHVDRVDILHDVGNSLNPAIDLGQVQGAFVQGMGWLTTEELWWDENGRLRTHAPSTYKIPLASDRPKIFNVELANWSTNKERTIRRSKAVGEPPLMLANSVLEALSMATLPALPITSICPRLDAPATPERILMAVERLKGA